MGMVTDMNALAKRSNMLHVLSDKEMQQLRTVLVGMLKNIDAVCKKYKLRYMLGYGSCLGAVRHGGFIPWDDDLDLLMPREDLKKFLNIFETELGDKYEYTAPNTSKESKNNFTKIYKKGTLLLEITDPHSPFPHGIYIDIFPLDYVPTNLIIRFIKGHVCNFLCKVAVSVFYAQYSSMELTQFMRQNKRMYFTFRLRQLFGKICSVISHKTWVNWADNFKEYKKTSLLTDGGNYFKRIMPVDYLFPTIEGEFSGQKVYLPHRPHLYLQQVYGKDYMQLPPEEKREQHFILSFNIDSIGETK